jgi:hypothetical protein
LICLRAWKREKPMEVNAMKPLPLLFVIIALSARASQPLPPGV